MRPFPPSHPTHSSPSNSRVLVVLALIDCSASVRQNSAFPGPHSSSRNEPPCASITSLDNASQAPCRAPCPRSQMVGTVSREPHPQHPDRYPQPGWIHNHLHPTPSRPPCRDPTSLGRLATMQQHIADRVIKLLRHLAGVHTCVGTTRFGMRQDPRHSTINNLLQR